MSFSMTVEVGADVSLPSQHLRRSVARRASLPVVSQVEHLSMKRARSLENVQKGLAGEVEEL